MTQITLTPDMVSTLTATGRTVRLMDEAGRLIGYAIPPAVYADTPDPTNPSWPFTEEELDAAEKRDTSGSVPAAVFRARLLAMRPIQ